MIFLLHTPRHFGLALAVAVTLSACDAGTTSPDTNASSALQLSHSLLELSTGDISRIGVRQNQDEALRWSSDNPEIATVDPEGLIAARKIGDTVIRAKSSKGQAAARVRVSRKARQIDVSPESSTLTSVGAQIQLQATTTDGSGNTQPASGVTWTSLNPDKASINPSGTVTAQANGTARMVGSMKNLADTVTVLVRIPNTQVASVALSPSSPTLTAGDSVRIVATARNSDGGVVSGTSFTWTWSNTTVAVVDMNGTVRGKTSGIAEITATTGGQSGSATVTVKASEPVPGTLNECEAPKTGWIWCDDFEQNRLASYFEHNTHNGDFTRAAGVGRDGSSGMRTRWQNAGQVGAGWMHVAFGRTPSTDMRPVDEGTTDYREIYWRFYLKNQPGWIGGGGHKISRAKVFAKQDFSEAMQALVWSSYQQPEYLVLDPVSYTDEAGTLTGTARWLGIRRGNTPVFSGSHIGQWQCIEARVRLNDAGQSNGIFQIWLNGTPEVSRTDLNWIGAYDGYGINTVTLDNYWNNGAPQAQERYIDNLVVSTERIGC